VTHGFARLTEWNLTKTFADANGNVKLVFALPDDVSVKANWPVAKVNFIVTVSDKLTMELAVANLSPDNFTFENCLHTYFEVGDISSVSVTGLKGLKYLDKVENFAEKKEAGDAIKVSSEVDRIYQNTTEAIEILDEKLSRKIHVEKHGSVSTVVWNPWIAKAQQMPDFGNDEYQRMLCVESGNVAANGIRLSPNETSRLSVKLSSVWLG